MALTALSARRISEPGLYSDGGGLYLQVTAGKHGVTKSWLYRFALNGHERRMGLGSFDIVSLQEAREKAHEARRQCANGVDPIETRNAQQAAAKLAAAKAMTFDGCVRAYIAAHEAGWSNAHHRQQWSNSLAAYAAPILGSLPVSQIDTGLVLKVLEPIWRNKTETAQRVRSRIELVLDWATVRGYRSGENPARWRGHLKHLLASPERIKKVVHFSALPHPELPGFMAGLRKQEGTAARCLEFAILTAARPSEAREARWSEFNLLDKIWTVPSERMKGRREHRVPLSDRALAILEKMQTHRQDDDSFVFPGEKAGKSVSNNAVLKPLQRMKRDDITMHGFRSTFSDWAAEQTSYPNHIVEIALAHSEGDKVAAAYRRTDLFAKRRRLMAEWARYATDATADSSADSERIVVSIR